MVAEGRGATARSGARALGHSSVAPRSSDAPGSSTSRPLPPVPPSPMSSLRRFVAAGARGRIGVAPSATNSRFRTRSAPFVAWDATNERPTVPREPSLNPIRGPPWQQMQETDELPGRRPVDPEVACIGCNGQGPAAGCQRGPGRGGPECWTGGAAGVFAVNDRFVTPGWAGGDSGAPNRRLRRRQGRRSRGRGGRLTTPPERLLRWRCPAGPPRGAPERWTRGA